MELKQFAQWIHTRWNRNARPADLAISGLGLSGEGAEVVEATLELVKAVGRVTEPLKKQIRGSKDVERTNLALELGDVLHYWCVIANHFNIDVEAIIEANVAKLEARMAADDVQGRK